MPNWCSNTLTLRNNNQEKISGLVKTLESKERVFNHLHPMPEELLQTESPNRNEEQSKLMEEKYGYTDWYSWCVNEWGSKWDADVFYWNLEEDNTVSLSFDTAWAPPVALYDRLVSEGWEVSATYHEPGMCFVGEYDNGDDNCYEYSDATSDTIGSYVPENLDEEYCISENMREWEENDEAEMG